MPEMPEMMDELTGTLCREVNHLIATAPPEEAMWEGLSALLKAHLAIREVSFYAKGEGGAYLRLPTQEAAGNGNRPARIISPDPFVNFLRYAHEPLLNSSLAADPDDGSLRLIRDRMDQLRADATIPFRVEQDLIGFANLGEAPKRGGLGPDAVRGLSLALTPVALFLHGKRLRQKLGHTQLRQRRADRLAALGTLTAGLAHEIRNPLVSIKTYFQLLPERYDDVEFRERFQKVAANEVERLARLVEELLMFARPSDPALRRANVQELIEEILTLTDSTAAGQKTRVVRDYPHDASAEIICDPEQIKQVLLNLATNAYEAVKADGQIAFRLRSDPDEARTGFVCIEVQDDGVGMAPENLEKLFTPFHTTKSSGTGLGLAISKQIIEEHLGRISVESREGEGTTFLIYLPRNPKLHERRKERNRVEDLDSRNVVR